MQLAMHWKHVISDHKASTSTANKHQALLQSTVTKGGNSCRSQCSVGDEAVYDRHNMFKNGQESLEEEHNSKRQQHQGMMKICP
jgi:hypothetical protein